MYVLGINISHDPSTCLVKDGEVLFYIENDRILRKKNSLFEYPINEYSVTGKIPAFLPSVNCIKKYTNQIDYVIFSSFLRTEKKAELIIIRSILNKLEESGIKFKTSIFTEKEHHLYHAASGFYNSGFDDAAALIMDGGGAYDPTDERNEGLNEPFREIETIYDCSYQGIKKVFGHKQSTDFKGTPIIDNKDIYTSTMGCGGLFNLLPSSFGLQSGYDAGKVMGLSGHHLGSNIEHQNRYIQSRIKHASVFTSDWFYEVSPGVFSTISNFCDKIDDYIENEISDISLTFKNNSFYLCAALANKLQEETYKHTVRLIKKSLKLTKKKNIILSGGYFLNCVNNYKYLKEFPNVNFYIDPIAHDGGTAIGAAQYIWYKLSKSKEKHQLKNLYIGP